MPPLHQSIHEAINVMQSLLLNLQMAENQADERIVKATKDARKMVVILYDMQKHIE